MAKLREYDAVATAKYAADAAAGKRVRLVGTLELVYGADAAVPAKAVATIGPRVVSSNDPLFGLRGKDVYVALTTE